MGGVWWKRGMGATASASPFVTSMANAIATEEGYGAPNSACTSINNPGCLRAGPGQTGTSAQGFAIFPDPATGYAALDNQIQTNINLGLNMDTFFAGKPGVYPGYAPSADSNNPTQYASFVASQLGVDPNTPLSQLQASYDAGGSVATSGPPAILDLTSASGSSDTGDSGDSSGTTDYTPYLVAAGVMALAVAIAT